MDKRSFEYTDSRLETGAAALYELNVVAGTDGFSFLAADPTGTILSLKSWHFDPYEDTDQGPSSAIARILDKEPLLNAVFSHVRYAVFGAETTLVPRRLFNHDELPAYFRLLLPPGDFEFGHSALPDFDCYLAYAVEQELASVLRQRFPAAQNMHLAAPVLTRALKIISIDSTGVMANLRHGVVQIVALERGNLLFYNTFKFDTASDLLYFVLLVYDQCWLNPDQVPLYLAGELLPDSEIYKVLYRYIRHLNFVGPPLNYFWPHDVAAPPDHLFFDLYSLKS